MEQIKTIAGLSKLSWRPKLGPNMFLVQCNHPGCNEHAHFKSPHVDWNCGKHVSPVPKKERGYLPNRHPHKPKYNYGIKEQ